MSQSFLKHTAIYGIASLLIPAASFLLLPLYTRALGPAEYGVLEVLNRAGEVAVFLLLLRGFRQAIFALHGHATTAEERTRVIASALAVVGIVGGIGIALALALGAPLAGFTQLASPALLTCGMVAVLIEGIAGVLMVVPQARLEAGRFVFLTIAHVLIRIALCVFLVTVLDWGLWGVITASLVTSGSLLALLVGSEVTRGLARPDPAFVREILRFSLPFLPVGIGAFLINNGDRFVLLRYCSTEEIGAYSLGYKLATAVALISRTPKDMVWSARMFELSRAPDAPALFGRMYTRLLACYVFTGMGLCFFAEEVVRLVAGERFVSAAPVITPVVIAYFFSMLADTLDSGLFVQRRTDLKPWITLASAVIVLVLYFVLIPMCGAVGAAYATIGAFAFSAAFTFYLAQKVFPVCFETHRVALLCGAAVAMTALAWSLPAELWAAPLKLLLLALTPLLLWWTGAFDAEAAEIAQVLRSLPWPHLGWRTTHGTEAP